MTNYLIRGGKIIRSNPFCPRCGAGVFMADRGEWWACGKCGDKYWKETFSAASKTKLAEKEKLCEGRNIKA